MNTYSSDKQEDKMPAQQTKGDVVDINMADGGQNYNIGYEGP